MSKEKILTIDDLPMHKDTYFFGYGIDIDKPYDMANQIIRLRQESQELQKQLEEMDSKLFFTKNELEMRQKSIDNKLRQQKEFIEWLEHYKKALLNVGSKITIDCVLEKYKEIVGGSNGK